MQNPEALVLLIVASLSLMIAVPLVVGQSASTTSTATTTSTSTPTTTSMSTSASTTASTTLTTAAPPLAFLSLVSTNSVATEGQAELLTVTISGGTPQYHYTYLVSNTNTGNVIFSSGVSNASASNSVSLVLPIEANDIGTLVLTANIADSNGANVIGTNTITVSAIPPSTSATTTTSTTTTQTTSSITSTTSTSTSTQPSSQSSSTSASTMSSTSSTASSSVSVTYTTTIAGVQTLRYQNGRAFGAVNSDPNGNARFLITDSVIKNLTLNVNTSGLTVGISVFNQSQVPAVARRFGGAAYQYIQLNGTANGQDVDKSVKNVTYNFTVSAAWLKQNGISPGSVSLFKFLPNGPDWVEVPTALTGSNATNYFYTAVSSSLSAYVIGFTTSNMYATGANPGGSFLSLSTTYNTFFFAAAGSAAKAGTSTAWSDNFITITSNVFAVISGASSGRFANVVTIGYNSFQIGTTVPNNGNFLLPSGFTNYNSVVAGIAANVIFNNNAVEVNSVTTAAATGNKLSFSVNGRNSIVFLLYAVAGTTFSTVKLPDIAGNGCTAATITSTGTNGLASVATANCLPQTTGTFTTNFFLTGGAVYQPNAITAIVFPQYNVLLKDSPANGNIVTNGTTQIPNNAIGVIGTGTANAIPFGANTFVSWGADTSNTANITFSSTSANQIALTVMGNAIVTATFSSPGTCIPVITNTLVNFGNVQPGRFAATANAMPVKNGGTVTSNIILYSTSTTTGNWVSGTLSFLTGNTLWDLSTRAANNGNQLTNTITTDTQNALASGDTANLFFGLNVPTGQAAATYTQGITTAMTC